MRQTNVIWVILLTIERGLDLLELKATTPLSTNLRNTPKHVQVITVFCHIYRTTTAQYFSEIFYLFY